MSSAETLETTSNPEVLASGDIEAASHEDHAGHDHQGHDHQGHDHEGHDHEGHHHEGHDHDTHDHGPALNPDCTREVSIDVPAEEVSKRFRKVAKQYQKQARIPGFRAGKVPDSLIRSRFAEQIRQDVVEDILPTHFRAAIEQRGLQPVSQPQITEIHLADGEPLRFKAIFEILPEFSIDGYQSVAVPKPDTTLTDAEYQAELARVLDSRSTMEPVAEERALVDGDWAEIDFTGVDGDETLADTLANPEPIEGSGVLVEIGGPNTLPAFNEALRGASVGQELGFEVTYPQDFGERKLAGKTIRYELEVKAIKKKILPELTDEFARELGDFETIDDFTDSLRDEAGKEKRRHLENAAKDALTQALVERFQFPVPESLVQQQVDARLDRGLRALASQGMKPEDLRKLDFDRLRAAQRDAALTEVKGTILLDKIADAERIEATGEEVEEQLQLIAYQSREPLEALRSRLTEDGSLARIREQLRREKTRTSLYERLGS